MPLTLTFLFVIEMPFIKTRNFSKTPTISTTGRKLSREVGNLGTGDNLDTTHWSFIGAKAVVFAEIHISMVVLTVLERNVVNPTKMIVVENFKR
jgi:hypothetical protein